MKMKLLVTEIKLPREANLITITFFLLTLAVYYCIILYIDEVLEGLVHFYVLANNNKF